MLSVAATEPQISTPPPPVITVPWSGFIANFGRMMTRRG